MSPNPRGAVIGVACVQMDPQMLDLEGNLVRSASAVRQAVEAGASFVVLPELVTSGYMFGSADELQAVALGVDDLRLDVWRRALAGSEAFLVAGIAERGQDGNVYNSAVMLDASGVVAVYRKIHLWNREKRFFAPGRQAAPVIRTAHGMVGVLVCYDLEFPEMPRSLALRGADLLLVPTNWGLLHRPAGESAPQLLNARMAARASHVFLAVCDRCGIERDQRWTGGSAVVDPEGWVLSTPDSEGMALAWVDLAASRDRQLSEVNHMWGDRRPELYPS
ncbi:nitrilase-related carbon-nitrogen hydrolase [Mycobacterium sp. AZCC_0083]|uniref:nitrilase-related carbon-nitrogen hydrolase n=1 Tax=Mycobacterium sp. AZCC_0083 TaxID=2735882 RepID=UPI002815D3CA|nr:nitrilase-related carbon-nitrogen hydrolase [Mycobacterium sp. AZCC_0083]